MATGDQAAMTAEIGDPSRGALKARIASKASSATALDQWPGLDQLSKRHHERASTEGPDADPLAGFRVRPVW